MSHEPPSTSASILVLHSAELDPYPFLAREQYMRTERVLRPGLTGTPESEDPLRNHVPWTIDNKYYTAEVAFRPHALGELGALQSYPVVMYLFDGVVSVVEFTPQTCMRTFFLAAVLSTAH